MVDALAAAVGGDAPDSRSGDEPGVAGREGGVDSAGLGVALTAEPAREPVAGRAADAAPARTPVDPHGARARVDTLLAQSRRKLFDVRLVPQGRIREGAAAPGLGRVLAGRTVHAVHLLGLGVVRLEVFVAERPRRRDPLEVLYRGEILLTEPGQARPVDLGVSADDVVDSRREAASRAVEPDLARPVAAVHEHRARRPVLRLAR